MDKVKIGVFGAYRGMTMIREILSSGNAELSAVCDMNEGLLENVKTAANEAGMKPELFTSFDEFIQCDMDAVVLANYANEHAPYAVRCLDSGRNVMSEVLACANMKEAVELAEAVERSGKVYAYAENYCYTAVRWEMRNRYRRGDIGEVIYGEGEYVHDCTSIWPEITYGVRNHWRNQMSSCYYNTHSLGPLLYMTGLKPVSVSGFEIPNTKPLRELGCAAGSASLLAVTLENGAVLKSLHGVGMKPCSHNYQINGEYGRLKDLGDGQLEAYVEKENQNCCGERTVYRPEFTVKGAEKTGHGGGDFFTTYYFINAILGDEDAKASIVNVYDALAMSTPGILGFRSAINGNAPQHIPDFRNPAEREIYRNDTFCTFKEIGGEQFVSCDVLRPKVIGDEVYERVAQLYKEGKKG